MSVKVEGNTEMDNHTYSVHVLMKKGKRGAASYIHNECVNQVNSRHLSEILDILLNPAKAIDEWETIDWLKWLIAGGKTPDEYSTLVRKYDNATTCGLVWIANYVAYRCRTCGISPCMSLCSECFKRADHTGHDFNMFRSQAGGACDCGDTSVMKVSGFCDRHGPNAQVTKLMPPQDLMCVAEGVMPRIILRLIQHLRENSKSGSTDAQLVALMDADDFITMFHDFCNMGAAMRHVMTSALTNPQVYKNLLSGNSNEETEYAQYLAESQRIYQDALRSLNLEPPPEFRHCQALQEYLVHNTFLDELVFWTVKFEFPQKIVTLLLNMLPDPEYKEALTQAFVLHYSRIAMMLERSTDPDTLSNRVVHVSVQLFSNEALAFRMTEQYYLLHIMVISLKFMMSKILIANTLHNPERNFHFNVDCGQQVMKEHCYWPLVSDLNNVLSHRPIAIKFMRDDSLLEMWFSFLSMFQGMNVNQRELVQHIEFEPTTYYAAFSAELEASAYPMWALVSHISDESTVQLNIRVINECLTALQDWFDAINLFTGNVNLPDNHQVSFHIPLHRYLSVFMCQAVNSQGVSLQQILPPLDMLHLVMLHPLRIQVAFYEIINGLWVRNGLQIKGQAMTYIQCNFCNSMVDADLYLLQVCATQLPTDIFMGTVIDKFHMNQWLTFSPSSASSNTTNDSTDYDTPMFESFLTFLATLVSIRTNLGINQGQLTELELVTLLCMGDKTHSALMELMPERCGSTQNRDFDSVLAEVADYRAPNYEMSGNMVQGMYVPKDRVWENLYSPIHVLLRAVHRRDFQTSMDRYTEYISGAGRIKSGNPPWPPLRAPGPAHPAYGDPRRVLGTRLFHSVVWIGLYKAVHFHSVSEHVMALIVFLLEMTVDFTLRDSTQQYSGQVCSSTRTERRDVKDLDLAGWYDTDWLSENLRTVIGSIALTPEPNVTFDDSDSEEDWCRVWSTSLVASNSSPAGLLNLSSNQIAVIASGSGLGESSGGGVSETALANSSEENAMEVVQSLATRPDASSAPSSSSSIVQSSPTPSSDSPSVSNPVPRAVMAGNEVILSSYPRGEPRPPGTPGLVDVVPRLTTSSPGLNGNGIPRLQGSNDVIPRLPHHHHKVMPYMGKRRNQPNSANFTSIGNDQTIEANESIISLLLKLHSHLSGTPDSFTPDPSDVQNESRVGDGAFFVAKVLNRIMALDELCKQSVLSTREKLWPRQPEETEAERKGREERERNERRRRAKERQQKLMEEFADKQKQFMEKAMASKDEEMEWDEDEHSQKETSKKEYDCVICNQTSPSTNENPMGLVVLMQATSVLGHKRRTQGPVLLPTSDEERQNLRRDETLACEFDKRVEELERNFERYSWLVSMNLGWEGGVHVQTCGHHLHLDCLSSYLNSLRGQQSTREYTCPLCRQLANSVLPLPPQLGETTSLIPSKEADMTSIINAMSKLMKENIEENIQRAQKEADSEPLEELEPKSNLMKAMTKAMQDMTNSTYPKFKHKQTHDSPFSIHHSHTLFLFVNSIARTNLEIELVQRGGTLVTTSSRSPEQILQVSLTTPKRSCFMPLLHVLAVHSRLMLQVSETVLKCLCQLAGIPVDMQDRPSAIVPYELVVPLLCRDPSALLMQLIVLLPLHIHQKCFSTVVKLLYNLLYFQVSIQLTCNMSEQERGYWRQQPFQRPPTSIDDTIPLTIHLLDPTQLFLGDDTDMSSSSNSSSGGEASTSSPPDMSGPAPGTSYAGAVPDKAALESKIQELCLPFLRIAALLKHHIYEEPLPEEIPEANEFLRLVYFLELVTDAMDWPKFNAAVALSWPAEVDYLSDWTSQLALFINRSQVSARSVLSDQHIRFYQPRLLSLPELYDKIFQYYHRKQCTQCQSIPRETSICLLCGTLVCLKENCCKQNNVCEAVQHSVDCGAGTAMFLVVTSSYVIVIRGKRACLWGSMYLDNHGEEDRELKRGKPLYLSPERYKLLEQQWIAHRFDHTNKKWVGHRDSL
ncbi:hypothetical protein M8J76_006269 [Diaphorina citri]|nr:hypothetical protein M8J75_005267 [Diaphorina citri]KAI5744894.1 hypothetical protein M8J76_006269 [Diaphorina citri]